MASITTGERFRGLAFKLVGLMALLAAAGIARAADESGADEQAAAESTEPAAPAKQPATGEDSVVVERRSEPLPDEAPAPSDEPLAPISQLSDYAPHPADPPVATEGPDPTEEAPPADEAPSDEPADQAAPANKPIAKPLPKPQPLDNEATEETPATIDNTGKQSTTDKKADKAEQATAAAPVAEAERVAEAEPVATEQAKKTVEKTAAADSPDRGRSAETGRATFRGVLPGETTKEQLIANWGEPAAVAKTEGGEVLLYQVERFERVDVLIENATVELVRVELIEREAPGEIGRRLRTAGVEPVEVVDPETGDTLAIAYPEKCLMLLLTEAADTDTPDTPRLVSKMVIGRPDAEAYALRAEQRSSGSIEKRLADLRRAMAIDPGYGYAPYLASGMYLLTGQVELAAEAATAAVEAEPGNTAYRLRRAQVLFDRGEYDQAVVETRAVLDAEEKASVVKAAALHTMGLLASLGDAKIADKAIGFHTMAISMADRLATSSDNKDRRAAKRLLVDAHLAVAKEVSRRDYDNKTDVVAQWIGRASGLAEEMLSNDRGGLELRLLVAREALASLANLKPTKDPQPWLDEAAETAGTLLKATQDPMMTARVEWMLGEAYYHAVRIEHTRGKADKALANGDLAIKHLMAGAATGDIRPSAEQLVGRLYFHLGAAQAVHKQDHEKAVEWYDQAYPLLTAEAPASKLFVPRRRGEALVSMAVSYWNQERKEHALELTTAGSELMQRAVEAGVLDEKALGVPYGNLATMHRRLGDEQRSNEFAKLARDARGPVATASRPARTGRSTPQSGAPPVAERPSRTSAPNRRSARPGRRAVVR